jgi:hypothetical protein
MPVHTTSQLLALYRCDSEKTDCVSVSRRSHRRQGDRLTLSPCALLTPGEDFAMTANLQRWRPTTALPAFLLALVLSNLTIPPAACAADAAAVLPDTIRP